MRSIGRRRPKWPQPAAAEARGGAARHHIGFALERAGPSSSIPTSVPGSTTTIAVATSTASTAASTTTALATPATDTGPSSFQLPSGNIGCYMDATAVRCDIRDRQWSPPARPAGCSLDYGQGILLSVAKATFVCAGDTTLGVDTLPYGAAARRGALVCNSTESGVSCRNLTTGRGFSLARQGYTIS